MINLWFSDKNIKMTDIIKGILVAAIIMTIGTLFLSFIYLVVNNLIFKLFIAAIYGALVGKSIEQGFKFAKLRDFKNILPFALILLILFIVIRLIATASILYTKLIFNFEYITNVLNELKQIGITLGKKRVITGNLIYLIWGIEILITFIISKVTAEYFLEKNIFCEVCQKYVNNRIEVININVVEDNEEFKNELENNNFDQFFKLERNSKLLENYLSIRVIFCDKCYHTCFLSIEERVNKVNLKGQRENSSKVIVTKLQIPQKYIKDIIYFVKSLKKN